MTGDPKVYIAMEDDGGQLVVKGPLSLLDRLVTTLTAQKAQPKIEPAPAAESQEAQHDRQG